MRQFDIVVYGSYGFTGRLIVAECKRLQLSILLGGRDVQKLMTQSKETGYPFAQVTIEEEARLREVLSKAHVVIHCAGPFKTTAVQIVQACLNTSTHYTDITGEYEVFEQLAKYDDQAKEKGIVIMPGTGFDVVPTDCLAVLLKKKLPSATHLQLAFAMTKGGLSRGTARTMIDGLGFGGMIRKNGKLTPIQLGEKVMEVKFGPFTRKAMCIPWGDISTAWRSTGIPNIEVYSAVTAFTIMLASITKYFNWLLRKQFVKDFLRRKVDSGKQGPDENDLNTGSAYLWGCASDHHQKIRARMKTLNGYRLTAVSSSLIAKRLIDNQLQFGYFTPAQYFGENLMLDIPGSSVEME